MARLSCRESFEVSRLRDLFGESLQTNRVPGDEASFEEDSPVEDVLPQLLTGYEATTVGGLVSEIAGHISAAGRGNRGWAVTTGGP